MSFGDRLKDLASKAGDKVQGLGEKGYYASRDLLNKAGAKAQNLGEKGVLMLEIKQLEGQAEKLTGRLGAEAYNAFVERGIKTLSADTAAVKEILAELGSLRDAIEKREAELEGKRG